jgi:hypothetical protein
MISARNRDSDMTGRRPDGQHRIPRLVPTHNTESLGAPRTGAPEDNGARAGG